MPTQNQSKPNKNNTMSNKMIEHKQNDTIYPKQFLLLFIMSSLTFKMTMLPQYLCEIAGRNAYLSMAYMLFIEVLMLAIVYGVISKGSLFELNIPKSIKGIFVALIIIVNLIKGSFVVSSATTYVGDTLFEKSSIIYVVLALLPLVMYMAHKGINILGRVCQIGFWFLVITFLYMFLFAQVDGVMNNLMPIEFSGDIFVACDKHLSWFCDFTPLLFASLVKRSKPSVAPTLAGVGFMVVCPILLLIVFISNFGGGASFVPNAFGKLAVYNRISTMLGTVDFPTVCTWIIMAILKISIICYGIVRGLKYFFGNKWWLSAIVGVIIYCIVYYGIRDLRTAYAMSTSWIRYFVAAVEFGLPMAIYVCMRIFDPNRKQKLSTDQKRSEKNREVQQRDILKNKGVTQKQSASVNQSRLGVMTAAQSKLLKVALQKNKKKLSKCVLMSEEIKTLKALSSLSDDKIIINANKSQENISIGDVATAEESKILHKSDCEKDVA